MFLGREIFINCCIPLLILEMLFIFMPFAIAYFVKDQTVLMGSFNINGFFDFLEMITDHPWGLVFIYFTLACSSFLIETLYATFSFTAYINRRSELESWDLQFQFQNLNANNTIDDLKS